MVKCFHFRIVTALALLYFVPFVMAQQTGSIRGMVFDKDFDAPLPAAEIFIAETGQKITATDDGNYNFPEIAPGTYTLVFSKEGYARQVKANVVVNQGQMTEVDASLSGDFTDMEEFVVQDVQIGGASEEALLELRMDAPALMDSISADLMSQAGASDAASALNLVAGTTVEGGKYAVVRGLPDRYVNSQMNGVRLPTADAEKRAVQLDQFPASVIESIQVTKTFTPDQQGDASGGAVNVVLKGIPDQTIFKVSSSVSYNTNVKDAGDNFLTYKGGGLNFWGKDDGSRDIQFDKIGQDWDGAVGSSYTDAPTDYEWSIAAGGKRELTDDIRIGAFANFYYERDSSHFENGIDRRYWIRNPGDPFTPQFSQGTPENREFITSLFNVTESSQQVQWGGLGSVGIETENHSLTGIYMYTRVAEDTVTVAEDTAGKKGLNDFWPTRVIPGFGTFPLYGDSYKNYDPYDPDHPANNESRDAAPYLRNQTLEYTERTTETLQLKGFHTFENLEYGLDEIILFLSPELDWTIAKSSSGLYQPDKRLFGSYWLAANNDSEATYYPLKGAANFTLGNLQRIWKDINEESDQYFLNLKFPFEQWSGDEGYLKFGIFNDKVTRRYEQQSYSNFGDEGAKYEGDWNDDKWSDEFPIEGGHEVTAADIDINYDGRQDISAWYYMADLPLNSQLNILGGFRFESTNLGIKLDGEDQATWLPPGALAPVYLSVDPDAADVDYKQEDVLPSISFVWEPLEQFSLRGSYSETVARQTFRELTPIQQMEYLGGDVFIGNPFLKMSSLKNYDLRLDWTPYEGGLISGSYFTKEITDPIEYVQRVIGFDFTTPINYPEGELSGYEIEVRQDLGYLWNSLEGLSIGGNATIIDSEVTLPQEEADIFSNLAISAPMPKRDMTNAPEHLYNIFFTYDMDKLGTKLGLFYTVRGDTLIAGAGESNGNLVANVYEEEYATLNFSITQKLGEIWKLKLQAKNLLDPVIKTVYRHHINGEEKTKTSYKKGIDYSISLGASF